MKTALTAFLLLAFLGICSPLRAQFFEVSNKQFSVGTEGKTILYAKDNDAVELQMFLTVTGCNNMELAAEITYPEGASDKKKPKLVYAGIPGVMTFKKILDDKQTVLYALDPAVLLPMDGEEIVPELLIDGKTYAFKPGTFYQIIDMAKVFRVLRK